MHRYRVIAPIVLAILASVPATAQTYDQLKKWCYDDGTDDQTIVGCDAVIKSGREPQANVSAALFNRGMAYNNKRQYDRAIQDFDQ